jgi:hypothetical protein
MTLLYLYYFSFILLFVCIDYMLSIVGLESSLCLGSYSAHSFDRWVGDRYNVGMVPRLPLSAITPYWLGRVVDRGGDSPVESFVVHPPSIRLVEHHYYQGSLGFALVFFDDITIHKYDLNPQ